MSRYCGSKSIQPVLDAAEYWKQTCLLENQSVFGFGQIWTSKNIEQLNKYYVDNLDFSEGNFLDKLKLQLHSVTNEAKILCAEILWVISLCPSNIKAPTKRENITFILATAGKNSPINSIVFSDQSLAGIGGAGQGYSIYQWRELKYCILLFKTLMNLDQVDRERLLNDGVSLAKWCEQVPENNNRQFRHMLLHLLHPDSYERIFSNTDRSKFIKIFSNLSTKDIRRLSAIQCDQQLAKIRLAQEKKFATKNLDWYLSPLDDVISHSKNKKLEPISSNSKSADVREAKPDKFESQGNTVDTLLETITVEQAMFGVFLDQSKIESILSLLKTKKNIVLQGPPGVGKSFIAKQLAYAFMGIKDKSCLEMIQFHQSYSYEDLVQGYRPGNNNFELKNGLFKQFCDKAINNPRCSYFFIIDEINRGNLSKIFGELMLLIESDKRGPDWQVPLTYSQSLDERFYIPENLYLIGLMNTADRSLSMVDYALRRRFAFIDLVPEFESEGFTQHLLNLGAKKEFVTLVSNKMTALNDQIAKDTANLGPGFCIGHSYFCNKPHDDIYDNAWYGQIIQFEIAPLIKEYWFDSPQKAEEIIDGLLV